MLPLKTYNGKNKRLILCVTGPMAAGKNAAAAILEKKGFACADADILAHQALEKVNDAVVTQFKKLAEEKNIQLTDVNGKIIRRNLGQLIFGSKELVEAHEKIIFPEINRLIEEFAEKNAATDIVINAAVLYKVPFIKKCDAVLYVDSPLIQRLFRARKRDGMPFSLILNRFKSQKNLFAKYKNSNADIRRVRNTGTLLNLEKKIDVFLKKLYED